MALFKDPSGAGGAWQFSDGTTVQVPAGAVVNVPDKFTLEALRMGLARADMVPVVATAGRPSANLQPGMQLFDSTLGRPIWRNAANSGWVDATGSAV